VSQGSPISRPPSTVSKSAPHGGVPVGAFEPLPPSPTAVAVHDDGDVPRDSPRSTPMSSTSPHATASLDRYDAAVRWTALVNPTRPGPVEPTAGAAAVRARRIVVSAVRSRRTRPRPGGSPRRRSSAATGSWSVGGTARSPRWPVRPPPARGGGGGPDRHRERLRPSPRIDPRRPLDRCRCSRPAGWRPATWVGRRPSTARWRGSRPSPTRLRRGGESLGERGGLGSGTAVYVLATLRTIATYRPVRLRVVVDGVARVGPTWLAAVGNARYYAGGMMITPGAELDDGLLDVCVIGGSPGPVPHGFPRCFGARTR